MSERDELIAYGNRGDDENPHDREALRYSHDRWHLDQPPVASCAFCQQERGKPSPDNHELFASHSSENSQ